MDDTQLVLSQEEAVEAIAFMLASARGLTGEPQDYGPMRLLAAAAWLCRHAAPRMDEDWEPILDQFAEEIPKWQRERMRNPQGYLEFIDECCRLVARELKRRNAAIISGHE